MIDYDAIDKEVRGASSGAGIDYDAIDREVRGGAPHVDVKLDYNPTEEKTGFLGGVAETILPSTTPSDYIEGPKFMAQHPIESLKLLGGALVQAHKDQFEKAGISFQDALKEPGLYQKALSLLEAGGHAAAGVVPLIGPAAATAGERIGEGETARGIGNAVGLLGPSALRAATPAIAAKAGEVFGKSAASDYLNVLAPTKAVLKQRSIDKVIPGMMERRIVAGSREGLAEKAAQGIEDAGQALDQGYAQLPKGSQSKVTPVLQELEQLKRDQVVNGVVVDKGKYKAIQAVQNDLRGVAGGGKGNNLVPSIDVEDAVKVRQILDKSNKTGTFGMSGKEADAAWARKQAANKIRANLADEYPNIAQLNKDFNFWSNLGEVIGETNQRKSSQLKTPLPQKVITAGALTQGIGWAATAHYLQKLISSPAWKTVSAANKSRLADFLADGKFRQAKQLMTNLTYLPSKVAQAELPVTE